MAKLARATCELCGLRIIERIGGWEHFGTQAGQRAEGGHMALPERKG